MSLRKLSDNNVETLIELWNNERALWDTTFHKYANADERKAALSGISQEMNYLDTSKSSTYVQLWIKVFDSIKQIGVI